MKKKIRLLLKLLLCPAWLFAQDMNFEETVAYIRNKMDCCRDKSFYRAIESVERNGKIKIVMGSDGPRTFDLFELFPDDSTRKGMSHGMSPQSLWYQGTLLLLLDTEAEGKRMYNALQHLKSVCVHPKDPFD